MVVDGVEGVGYNEIVEIETQLENRQGTSFRSTKDVVVIQVFEGTSDLNTKNTKTRFYWRHCKIGVSKMMGF